MSAASDHEKVEAAPLRMICEGVHDAASHVQRDERALADHAGGRAPDSLRFHRFQPCVSIGRHQAREREARLAYCSENDITVVRRGTAGGALYLDPGLFCFSLTTTSARLGDDLASRLAAAAAIVAEALAAVGIPTHFKAPNDLQVASRQKIASVFLAENGPSTQIFGTIIADLDLKRAMQALLVPTEKLTVTGLEHARERLTSLSDLLGPAFDEAELQRQLARAAARHLGLHVHEPVANDDTGPRDAAPIDDGEAWNLAGTRFETKDRVEAATLRLLLDIDADGRLSFVRFATDAHLSPGSHLADLAGHLTGRKTLEAAGACIAWLADHPFDGSGLTAAAVTRLVERAIAKWQLQAELGLSPAQTSGLMLAGPGHDPRRALAEAQVMLVPYCAKPNWCKWRHTIDCVECGMCEVGDAYALARDRNMDVVTITNFEHLAATLDRMKTVGVRSYVGMCCGEFFLKRHQAFRDSGMDAVLLDIEGATCYELKEENLAYAGAFTAEAALDIDAVRRLMVMVPPKDIATRSCVTGLASRPGDRGPACAACRASAPAKEVAP